MATSALPTYSPVAGLKIRPGMTPVAGTCATSEVMSRPNRLRPTNKDDSLLFMDEGAQCRSFVRPKVGTRLGLRTGAWWGLSGSPYGCEGWLIDALCLQHQPLR